MGEIKIYRIEGFMLISQDKLPRWAKFVKEIRALKPEHALEKLYSEMGSRHGVRRPNIRIVDIREIGVEEARSKYIKELAGLTYMVIE
ncbi:MAG: 50S ribosomal protein L18Ae [Ignisphaera sp.]